MNINQNEIEVTKVNLTEKTILDFLNSGVTWYKKDDVGYGSIEDKYNANPSQIEMIRKHPSFKGVKTKVTIFNIIKDDTLSTTEGSTSTRTSDSIQQPTLDMVSKQEEVAPLQSTTVEAADIFANL